MTSTLFKPVQPSGLIPTYVHTTYKVQPWVQWILIGAGGGAGGGARSRTRGGAGGGACRKVVVERLCVSTRTIVHTCAVPLFH